MPAREISTKIKLEGEKEFNSALRDAQRELRVMNSDLKAAAAEFEFTGDKQAMLTAKSRILRDEIAKQDKIVSDLAEMVEKSKKAYGEASSQTDGYRIKLSNATSTLFKMKQQLAETDREAEELGRDSTRVGRQIKDGIGDAAEETSESLDDMIQKLSSDVGDIKSSTTFTALSAGANFVTGSIEQIMGFVESSREYRNKHARATNALEKNLNASEWEINQLYLKIVGVTGNSDSAYEALVTLSKTGAASFEELNNILDIILGAYIQFGEEAKPEDVAESLQESVSSGTLTGKIAELYERLGLDVDAINKAIKDLPPKERLQAIINGLMGKELTETYRAFYRNEENLIKENQKMAELELARAKLADELSPIVIGINDKLISIINSITDTLRILKGDVDKAYEELHKHSPEFAGALESGQLDTMGGTLKYVWDQLFGKKEEGEEQSDYAPKKEANEKSPVEKALEFVRKKLDDDNLQVEDLYQRNQMQINMNKQLGNMGSESDSEFEKKGTEAGEAYVEGFIKTVENSDVDQTLKFLRERLEDDNLQVEDIFQRNELQKNMTEQFENFEKKGTEAGEAYTDAVEKAVTDEVPTMQEITEAFLSGGDEAVQSLIDSRTISEEDKAELINMLEMLGMTSGTKFDDSMNKAMAAATKNAEISGANIGTALKNGLDSTMPIAIATAQTYYNQLASLNAAANTTVVPPQFPGKPQTAGTVTTEDRSVPVILEMNGRELGRGILPAINSMQGRNLARAAIT